VNHQHIREFLEQDKRTLNAFQGHIESITHEWAGNNRWHRPNAEQCCNWTVIEAAEVREEFMRLNDEWSRNNEDNRDFSYFLAASEFFDVIMMATLGLAALGYSFDRIARLKLGIMHISRVIGQSASHTGSMFRAWCQEQKVTEVYGMEHCIRLLELGERMPWE